MQVLYSSWNRIWRYGILWKEKKWSSQREPLRKSENNDKLDPYIAPGWNWTWATLVGAERSNHYAIPAPKDIQVIETSSGLIITQYYLVYRRFLIEKRILNSIVLAPDNVSHCGNTVYEPFPKLDCQSWPWTATQNSISKLQACSPC